VGHPAMGAVQKAAIKPKARQHQRGLAVWGKILAPQLLMLPLAGAGMGPRTGGGTSDKKIATRFLAAGLEAPPALVLSPEVVNLPAQAFDGSRDVVDIIAGDWLCLVGRGHGWGAGLTPRVWTIW
jgi:hypothetical protein